MYTRNVLVAALVVVGSAFTNAGVIVLGGQSGQGAAVGGQTNIELNQGVQAAGKEAGMGNEGAAGKDKGDKAGKEAGANAAQLANETAVADVPPGCPPPVTVTVTMSTDAAATTAAETDVLATEGATASATEEATASATEEAAASATEEAAASATATAAAGGKKASANANAGDQKAGAGNNNAGGQKASAGAGGDSLQCNLARLRIVNALGDTNDSVQNIQDPAVQQAAQAGLDQSAAGIKTIAQALQAGQTPPAEGRDETEAGLAAAGKALAGGDGGDKAVVDASKSLDEAVGAGKDVVALC